MYVCGVGHVCGHVFACVCNQRFVRLNSKAKNSNKITVQVYLENGMQLKFCQGMLSTDFI